jgi:hypothetical protein
MLTSLGSLGYSPSDLQSYITAMLPYAYNQTNLAQNVVNSLLNAGINPLQADGAQITAAYEGSAIPGATGIPLLPDPVNIATATSTATPVTATSTPVSVTTPPAPVPVVAVSPVPVTTPSNTTFPPTQYFITTVPTTSTPDYTGPLIIAAVGVGAYFLFKGK